MLSKLSITRSRFEPGGSFWSVSKMLVVFVTLMASGMRGSEAPRVNEQSVGRRSVSYQLQATTSSEPLEKRIWKEISNQIPSWGTYIPVLKQTQCLVPCSDETHKSLYSVEDYFSAWTLCLLKTHLMFSSLICLFLLSSLFSSV